MTDDQKDARDIAEDEYAGMIAAGMEPCSECGGAGLDPEDEQRFCPYCNAYGLVWPNLDEHGDSLASGDELLGRTDGCFYGSYLDYISKGAA